MKTISDLGTSNKCSGCTACAKICPKGSVVLERNKKGFLYPRVIENNCVKCNSCLNNCPWLIEENHKLDYNQRFYSAKRKDFKKRMLSQSGGAFSVFAEHVVKQKGIVYGVEFINKEAKYCRVTTIRQLKRIRGSKYVQASVGNIFDNVARDLKNNKSVLFSGTACHVEGLINYLKFKNIDATNLITVDIVCHGVVSPLIFGEYISYIEKYHNGKLKYFNFRDKTFGWHGHFVTYKVGSKIYKSKDYVKIFYSSYSLRDTCYECKYASLNRISDITIGDSWGIGDYYPNFDDNKGCSLIIENSEKGKLLIEATNKEFDLLEIKKEEALQPNLQHPTEKPVNYESFWHDYFSYGFEYVAYKYCDFNPGNELLILKKYQVFKRFIAKIKRIFGF